MSVIHIARLLLVIWFAQTSAAPPYVLEGDRVEQQFRAYTYRLAEYFESLRTLVAEDAPALLPELEQEDPPNEPGVYGYQLLPRIVEEAESSLRESISSFSYSWSVTAGYLRGENQRLGNSQTQLRRIRATDEPATLTIVRELIDDYRTLVDNHETVDQYLQYNRFWQRAIAEDRRRFDRLTEFYELLVSGDEGADEAIREFLGRPTVPSFISFDNEQPGRTILKLPVYTDIGDEDFLKTVESGVELMWSVDEGADLYALDIEFRTLAPAMIYATERTPERGDHIDLTRHSERFPEDGALLTTGAESTFGFVGEYVALGPGEITVRTLAHEFGHVLGFVDGYIRGYRDLEDQGFEILELTSVFDDIMSAPREGHVLASHFELLVDGFEGR